MSQETQEITTLAGATAEALLSDWKTPVDPTPGVGETVIDYLIALKRSIKQRLAAQEDIALKNAEEVYRKCCEACPPKE